jgi:hypothetical protein
MRSMLAQLSPHEENTLGRIGFGTEGELDAALIYRLWQLALIEWSDGMWCLTAVGRLRRDGLAGRAKRPREGQQDGLTPEL